jgi:hypothetical protein
VTSKRPTPTLITAILALIISIVALVPSLTAYLGFESPGAKRQAQNRAWDYFAAWKSGRLDKLQARVGKAAPGSPAFAYATAQYEAWFTYSHAYPNQQPPKSTVRKGADYSIVVCTPAGGSTCYSVNDFSFDATSTLLTDYTINGLPVRGRVVNPGQWVNQGDIWFRITGSYISVKGLEVVVQIQNYGDKRIAFSQKDSCYRDYNNIIHRPAAMVGRTVYNPGDTGRLWYSFPGQLYDGRLVASYIATGSERAYEYLSLTPS